MAIILHGTTLLLHSIQRPHPMSYAGTITGFMELVDGLPPSVASIAESLARWAKGYDNHLKWDEKAKFKADLMNARRRWHSVSPDVFAAKLRKEGMRGEDIAELVDWLRKAQAGHRLVPQRSYRGHVFGPPPEQPEFPPLVTSRDWQ